MSSEDYSDIAHIAGNASADIKRAVGNPSAYYGVLRSDKLVSRSLFGDSITDRLVCTEVSINKNAEEPKKMEAKVVLEVTVSEDMVNGGGNIHGGCTAFLIDICSTMALTALSLYSTEKFKTGVSQSLNVLYHSPAVLGDVLRLVNTTLTVGARTFSLRTEIWNVTHHRLVATGIHVKMQASRVPKSRL